MQMKPEGHIMQMSSANSRGCGELSFGLAQGAGNNTGFDDERKSVQK